jgi:hypothetical protein
MTIAPDRAQLVEDLARMMDELCAPELTLARSEVVRSRVARLLDTLREPNDSPRAVALLERPEAERSWDFETT